MSKYAPLEVYPLFMSMAAALGICGYALKRKWVNDPNINFSKATRMGGVEAHYDGIEDVKPFWSEAKHGAINIFGPRSNPIIDNKKSAATGIIEVTVPSLVLREVDDEEPAEDEVAPVEEVMLDESDTVGEPEPVSETSTAAVSDTTAAAAEIAAAAMTATGTENADGGLTSEGALPASAATPKADSNASGNTPAGTV